MDGSSKLVGRFRNLNMGKSQRIDYPPWCSRNAASYKTKSFARKCQRQSENSTNSYRKTFWSFPRRSSSCWLCFIWTWNFFLICKPRSVPVSCCKIYTPINDMFARAVSFCRFSFFMKNKIPLLPKFRKNVWFKSRSVPGSCCKIWHQCAICLHEHWVLTGVSLFLSFF